MTVLIWWANLGIRVKFAILIELAMIALGAATGVVATVRQRATLEDQLCRRGLAIANDLATFAVRPVLANDLATLRRFVNHTTSQDYVRYVSVLDTGGRVVMHSDLAEIGVRRTDALSRAALAAPAAGFRASVLPAREEPVFDIYAPVTAAGARLGTVVLGYSRTSAETEIARVRSQILLVGLLAAVFAGGLAYLLSSYISVPVTRIADAMRTASDGAVPVVLPLRRADEIGMLARSFNTMAEDLARHRRHLEELVAARTAELLGANARLEGEIVERTRAETGLRESRKELRDLASHLQVVREQERTQIAREIHDELGQALTALKMDVHWVSQRVTAESVLTEKTRSMSAMIDTTVHAVRRISSELRPKLLDDLGLSAAIEWQAREFEQRSGVDCDVRSEPDDIVLDPASSTALFRVFQETLTNVARHAGARRIDVLLRKDADVVELVVVDDGAGITAEQASNARSLGIVGMRERVYSLGGTFEIGGQPGLGTTVRVTIPAGERARP
jgi:signal transduction histidine kinase